METTVPEVRVEIPHELRSLCGGLKTFNLVASDVRGLLAELARQYPQVHVRVCDERGEPRPHINVFRNNDLLPRDRLDTPLVQGDVVSILPAVSGG